MPHRPQGLQGRRTRADAHADPGCFNAAAILPIVLILLLIACVAAAFLKFRKKKPDTSGDTDLDDYEFPEDDEEDEAK